MHTEAGAELQLFLSIALYINTLRKGLTELEAHCVLARLAGQQILWIHLPLPTNGRVTGRHSHATLLHSCYRSELRSLHLQSKCSYPLRPTP